MRQLDYVKARSLAWHEVTAPSLPSDEGALVRPLVVTTCDMDGVVSSGAAPFKGPLPVGHEGVAEIIEVGDRVTALRPGDRVIAPWKISCGACDKCRAGLTAHCLSVVPEAAYSWGPTAREWGGFLSDVVAVPWAEPCSARFRAGSIRLPPPAFPTTSPMPGARSALRCASAAAGSSWWRAAAGRAASACSYRARPRAGGGRDHLPGLGRGPSAERGGAPRGDGRGHVGGRVGRRRDREA
jgi:threonine dehydrogenase-like Zn-dependent dehydrogenase